MKILILGSGILGTTLAYVLQQRGHKVTVIDRNNASALECSFANGGQLSYSHAEPWATPAVLPKVIQWLGKKDAPLVFRMRRIDPAMWAWAFQFLRYCTPARSREGTRIMLELALYSKECLEKIMAEVPLDFHYEKRGIMQIFSSAKDLEKSLTLAKFQEGLGCPFELLSSQQALAKEPALAHSVRPIVGAIYFPYDATGDAYHFTQALIQHSQRVIFQYNTTITSIEQKAGQITCVITDKGDFTADAYVMALGADSPLLLKKLGIRVPIYPMKGYSVSIPIADKENAPSISITDMSKKIVCTTLGDSLRVAGTAEFTGYDTTLTEHRLSPLIAQVKELFPHAGNFDQATKWACLRPSTPSGLPILGKTKYSNLYLNTGHGSLGWTLNAGSAYIVADSIEGKEPGIIMQGLGI